VVHDLQTLVRIALDPDLYFGDAYSAGRVEILGNLTDLLTEGYRRLGRAKRRPWYHRVVSAHLRLLQRNTMRGSRRNIHHHYDLNTDFYRLWLDEGLVYTCAYFRGGSESIEAAQIAKMDHVCRKLRLRPGERVVEAGCGWGTLALHMARNCGVSVRAYNISSEQIRFARRRAEEEGLAGQVEFVEDDYRNISGAYDAFVSVGMLEHVGPDHYLQLGAVIDRTLGKSGRGFLHFIGRNRDLPLNAWIRKRIFPGAHPPTLKSAMDVFERFDFSVLDVENLRLHYARTLEHWLARFEQSVERITAMYDDAFVRAWRLYLAGSLAAFRAGWLQLFQVTFARGSKNDIPWTRQYLYDAETDRQPEHQWTPAMS
jgi:cyclopropane-fatty-acyl-phospholipid synthase